MKKKFFGKLFAVALVAMVAVIGLTGCSSGGSTGDTLKFACINYSDSIDPSAMTNAAWANSRYGIGECLFRFDSEMNANEYLCDKYTANDAMTEFEFHIKDGVKFSNGDDVTASAVVKSIEYVYAQEKSKAGKSTPSAYLKYDKLTADDSTGTVTMTTSTPYANITGILAHPYFVIMDIDGTDDMANKPIGTGPYAIDSYDAGVSLNMVANENYWNGAVPYKNLKITFTSDSTTKAMALENGDVDVVENITTITDLDKLRENSDYTVSETTSARCGFSYMNQKGVLANADLRKAILMAIDDDTMCEKTVGGMYSAGYSVLPSSLDYNYDKLKDATPYNVEEAKKVLDAAGIKDSDGDGYRELDGKVINLNYLTYDSRNLIDFTEAVTESLKEIGIKATINTTDGDTEWNKLVEGDYDLLANNWLTVPTGDPYTYFSNWYSKSEDNYCGYSNAEYDKVYEALATETDATKRQEGFQQLQQFIIDDAAVLVHGYYHSNMCSNNTIKGADIETADYYWITNSIQPK